MFDIGWTEIAIIAVVALVVVGPKDLPGVIRSVGRWSGKARKVTRDFQRNFETMAEETELAEVRREIAEANRELTNAGRIPVDDTATTAASGSGNDIAGGSTPPEPGPAEPDPTGPAPATATPASPDADDTPSKA
jgi:sec-independent protein translocase protein TatB